MCHITFRRVAPDEARILADGEHVGDVYRQPDILYPGRNYFVIHLDEDFRGPVRVHDRSRIREVAAERIRYTSASGPDSGGDVRIGNPGRSLRAVPSASAPCRLPSLGAPSLASRTATSGPQPPSVARAEQPMGARACG